MVIYSFSLKCINAITHVTSHDAEINIPTTEFFLKLNGKLNILRLIYIYKTRGTGRMAFIFLLIEVWTDNFKYDS